MRTEDVKPKEAEDVRFVAREGGWAGLIGIAGAGARYLNTLVLTHLLGSNAYGLYALANTIVSLLGMPANMGLPVSSVHFVAVHRGRREWAALRWVVRASLRLVVISSLVWTALILLLAPWGSVAIFGKEQLLVPLVGLSLALPLLGITAVYAGILQGLKQIRAKVLIDRIAHPLVFSVLMLLGGYFFPSVVYVLVCFFVAALLVTVLCAVLLRNQLKALPLDEDPVVPRWRELLGFATPMMFLSLLNYFIRWSDVLVMGIYRSPAEVGIYHIASRLAVAVNMPTESLNSSLAPSFSSLHGTGDTAGVERTFHSATRWIFTLSGLIFLPLTFGGPWVLWFFGEEFQAGHLAMCLLAAGHMFSAAMGTNGTLLTMTGHPQINLLNAIFLGVMNLVLNLALVPHYGAVGAAGAAAASLVLVNITRCIEIRYVLGTVPWDRTLIKPLAAFALASALGWVCWATAGSLTAGLVAPTVFALALWILGLEAEDLDLLRRARRRFGRNG